MNHEEILGIVDRIESFDLLVKEHLGVRRWAL